MDTISIYNHQGELQLRELGIASLLFADDVVLMESLICDLQHSFNLCTAEYEEAGMRIGIHKSVAMVLSGNQWISTMNGE